MSVEISTDVTGQKESPSDGVATTSVHHDCNSAAVQTTWCWWLHQLSDCPTIDQALTWRIMRKEFRMKGSVGGECHQSESFSEVCADHRCNGAGLQQSKTSLGNLGGWLGRCMVCSPSRRAVAFPGARLRKPVLSYEAKSESLGARILLLRLTY